MNKSLMIAIYCLLVVITSSQIIKSEDDLEVFERQRRSMVDELRRPTPLNDIGPRGPRVDELSQQINESTGYMESSEPMELDDLKKTRKPRPSRRPKPTGTQSPRGPRI